MLPTFDLGPWHIGTYSAVYIVALLLCGMYSFHRLLTGLEAPPQVVVRGTFLAILGGFAGSYLVQAVVTVQHWLHTGELVWMEGSSFVGVVGGGGLVGLLYCRAHRIPLGRAFDRGGALPLPLGQALGRLGCLAAGCCYGRPTDSWLGLYLPDASGTWAVRYPTQLLAAAANLLIFFTLLAVERYGQQRSPLSPLGRGAGGEGESRPFNGFLFLLYLDLYCLKRFLMEFLRGDAIPLLGPITWVHLYTLAGLVAATALIVWRVHRPTTLKGGE
jgi:phosphatidylglycerol:prolipoprotein diacylglycerol transferase